MSERKERRYPDMSIVTVTFVDGEVKEYRITAGLGISQYLAREAGETGILTLFNGEESHGLPMSQVREYIIKPYREEVPADEPVQT